MSKINLKTTNQILSEKEMKNVLGGVLDPYYSTLQYADGFGPKSNTSFSAKSEPCKNSGCSGPHGASVPGGGLCCLLPCNGIFGQYGYGIVRGMSKCP